MQTALFIGRFQPLHNGHLAVVKRLARKNVLKIGIGSSQYSNTKDNPLSGKERQVMVHAVLRAEHINAKIFLIPDIHDDAQWAEHVRKVVGQVDIAYSGNQWVIGLFKKANIPCRRIKEISPYEATKIRELIAKGKAIDQLVPKAVLEFMKQVKAFERIRKQHV